MLKYRNHGSILWDDHHDFDRLCLCHHSLRSVIVMKIVLLGAPGCGKGTFAVKLSKHLKIPAISTGDLVRDEIKVCHLTY